MINWDALISEQLFAAVLPGSYRRYIRPLRDGLVWFLRHLPSSYQQHILSDQFQLPATASAAQRLATIARSCPSLHKLGQTLARDHRLSRKFRHQLQQLESLPATTPLKTIRGILQREFEPLHRLHLGRTIAEGSVAVVVAFTSHDGQQGVLKILKPHIEERLDRELCTLAGVGALLDEDCEALGIPHLDYEESLRQVHEKLRMEVRLDLEQHHLRQAAAMYARDSAIHIPALFPHCTHRVTAMEEITGVKLTDRCFRSEIDKRRAAHLAVSALVARPVFAADAGTLFHADPHGGNLFFTDDHRLAILDWSLVSSLKESERVAIVQMVLGGIMLQSSRVAAALASLAHRGSVHEAALLEVARAWVNRVRKGALPGMTWLIGLLDVAIQTTRLRVPADMMLFRRAYHALEGVLADMGAGSDVADVALAGEFFAALAREWPSRWLTPAMSRALPTRLSNWDLGELMMALPWTATMGVQRLLWAAKQAEACTPNS